MKFYYHSSTIDFIISSSLLFIHQYISWYTKLIHGTVGTEIHVTHVRVLYITSIVINGTLFCTSSIMF